MIGMSSLSVAVSSYKAEKRCFRARSPVMPKRIRASAEVMSPPYAVGGLVSPNDNGLGVEELLHAQIRQLPSIT